MGSLVYHYGTGSGTANVQSLPRRILFCSALFDETCRDAKLGASLGDPHPTNVLAHFSSGSSPETNVCGSSSNSGLPCGRVRARIGRQRRHGTFLGTRAVFGLCKVGDSINHVAPLSAPSKLMSSSAISAKPKGLYTASVNPTRKAKRARLGDSIEELERGMDVRPAALLPSFILPKPTVPSTLSAEPAVQAPVRRGRKPSAMSRASREAQRKLNHSIIEKARRTKINEALMTLSSLVPSEYDNRPIDNNEMGVEDAGADDSGDDDEDYIDRKQQAKRRASGGPKKEKEFKLEILTKTVAYMQDLIQRVDSLETEVQLLKSSSVPLPSCATCGPRADRKRKCIDEDLRTSPPFATDSPAIRKLPSISEMLPDRSYDPDPASYLPSPPSSARFPTRRGSTSLDIPPPLFLGPTLQAAVANASRGAALVAQSPAASPPSTASPTLSPLPSPEDESAASVLLHMKKVARVAPTSSSVAGDDGLLRSADAFRSERSDKGDAGNMKSAREQSRRGGKSLCLDESLGQDSGQTVRTQTPSSLLGMDYVMDHRL